MFIHFSYSIKYYCFKGFFEAMRHIRKKTSNCVKFRKKRPTDKGYVEITSIEKGKGIGCWSEVGYMGRRQGLNLQKSKCMAVSVIVHELMHSLGFYHEQSRYDRDGYVTILKENIRKDKFGRIKYGNFIKRPKTDADLMDTPYDYCSIMHYKSYSFGKVSLHPNLEGLIL